MLNRYKNGLLRWLRTNRAVVSPIDKLLVASEPRVGLHFWAFRDFYGRGLHDERQQPEIHATYEFEQKVKLRLLLDRMHVAPGSPSARLSGHQSNLFVFGSIQDVTKAEIVARPVFIGDVHVRGESIVFSGPPESWMNHGEISPNAIDTFGRMRNERMPRAQDLDRLWATPEVRVKEAICEIIGEPDIPKDWGGERSDLFSSNVRVCGSEVSTAFLLKGPGGAKTRERMTFKHLGKNGDQIDRLFTEPADLLVLQYCGSVHTSIRNTLRAYAKSHTKRFAVLDGTSTARLLAAYGKCGFESRPVEQTSPQSA